MRQRGHLYLLAVPHTIHGGIVASMEREPRADILVSGGSDRLAALLGLLGILGETNWSPNSRLFLGRGTKQYKSDRFIVLSDSEKSQVLTATPIL